MSTDPSAPSWAPLTENERRVLGVLVEKQKTAKTADAYPLTLNSLVTGCNQKSNRDPVLDLTDDEVEETLSGLQPKGLVSRLVGGRVDKFRHLLYEVWTSDGKQLAVLAELLLRGPQTRGELRGRASRMAAIDTLDDLEEVLRPLHDRKLVVYLDPPDRRGALLTHGFHTADELARVPARAAEPEPRAAAPERGGELERRLTDAEAEIAGLKQLVADLSGQLADLKKSLGAG
jgi:uncharacterized protein YceH (UPF0502 family)